MRIFLLFFIILLSCKGRSHEAQSNKVEQINALIESNVNYIKECYQDSFFEKREQIINRDTGIERGKYIIGDTFITTFFCDTLGKVHMASTVFGKRSRRSYMTYFSRGNIVKVVESFSTDPEHLDISEFYIDQDIVFFKREGEHHYSDMKSWIPFIETAYNKFDSTKKNK